MHISFRNYLWKGELFRCTVWRQKYQFLHRPGPGSKKRKEKKTKKMEAILTMKDNVSSESEQLLLYIPQKTKIMQAKPIKQELGALGYQLSVAPPPPIPHPPSYSRDHNRPIMHSLTPIYRPVNSETQDKLMKHPLIHSPALYYKIYRVLWLYSSQDVNSYKTVHKNIHYRLRSLWRSATSTAAGLLLILIHCRVIK